MEYVLKFFYICLFGLILLINFFVFGSNPLFALSGGISEINITGESLEAFQQKCIKDKYYIDGLDKVKLNTNVVYVIRTKENLKVEGKVEYKLYFGKNLITSGYSHRKINLVFNNTGLYILKVLIKESKCSYKIEKKIIVYNSILVYLGTKNEKLSWIKPLLSDRRSILFVDIIIPEKGYYTWDEFLDKVSSYIYYIQNSDYVILYYPNLSYIFDGLVKIKNLYNVDFSNKQIFLIRDMSFLDRKILIKYMKVLAISEIGVVDPKYFLDFFNSLLNKGEEIDKYVYFLKLTNLTESKYLVLSSIVNWLIYNGFPSNLLSLILLIPLVLLIITFFRQMIGFHVFGVYNPLIFSLILVVFGFKFSLLLFLVGFIAVLISKFFIRKIYLLYSSKLTLFYIIYILTLIFFVYLSSKLGIKIISSDIFKNILVVFPIISFGVVINKLVTEETNIVSIKFLVSLTEFLVLSFIGYFVFVNTYLQNLFLVYPEIIMLIFLINIIIGRFTGLQLFEYFRFMPLIKKQFEE